MTERASVSERVSGWLETIGALALFMMMAVTFLDIAGRFVLHRPLAGSTDLVQILLLLTAGCTLPAITWRGEHLSIGIFDGARSTAAERARRAAVGLVVAVIFGVLAVLLWRHGGETARNGDVIGYLRIAIAPFVYALSGLSLASGLVALALVRKALRAPDAESAPPPVHLEQSGATT